MGDHAQVKIANQISRRRALQFFTAATATDAAAAARSPNFVLITCDDLGYADIRPYRRDVEYTPNLDRMAREGMRFTSWYAAPLCTPSRAALMTGCYPKRIGLERGSWHPVIMPGDWHGLNPSEITVARLLKQHGYTTACIGKWHLGDQPEFLPTRHGFDSYYGLPYSNDMRPLPQKPGVDRPPHPPLPLMRNEKVLQEVKDQAFLTGAYTEEAIRFIEANRKKPFFLYLPHSMVHVPLAAGARFLGKTGKGLYADAVAEVDWSVGEILACLERLELTANTVVVFLSDNGGSSRDSVNTPLKGRKGSAWEGGIRVPALAWWPGHVPRNAACHEIASNMDVLPTFARLAGAKPPRDRKIDGYDISGLLTSKKGAKSRYDAFYYYMGANLKAVRSGPWKLHATGELYNLDDDLGEMRNVADANSSVVARLNRKLEEARVELGDGTRAGANCRPVGTAKGPLRFQIPRHPDSGYPPHAPIVRVPGSPVEEK
jgi:arylsulfatase A